MSDVEYLGQVNPKRMISFEEEERIRMDELKQRKQLDLLKKTGELPQPAEPDLSYERDNLELLANSLNTD